MLYFRPIRRTDLPFLNRVRNSYAKEFLHDSRTFSIEETVRWFDKTNPDYYVVLQEDELIGYFRLHNHSKSNGNLYMGLDLDKPFLGTGVGYLAYMKFLPYLFEKYDLHKVSLEVLSTNTRAFKFYQKLGFVQEGIKRDEVFKSTKYVDSIVFSMLKSEYETRYGKVCQGPSLLSGVPTQVSSQ